MQLKTSRDYHHFGSGGYYFPQDPDNPVYADIYELFWRYVQKLVPDVLGSLCDDVLPIYQRFIELLKKSDILPLYRHDREPLEKALENWVNRWNLQGLSGVYETAYYILNQWTSYPSFIGSYTSISNVTTYASIPIPDELHVLNFSYRPWQPEWETEDEYMKECKTEFEKHLNSYIGKINATVNDAGMVKSPTKRNMAHFEWLILYQIEGMSYRAIAEKFMTEYTIDLSEDTISKAIRSVAELIHLTLRQHHKSEAIHKR